MLRNDASMVVPADGASPRMQMCVWDGPSASSVTVQPGGPALSVGAADFGPQSFQTTGALVLADDGTGPFACNPLVDAAAVSGAVALVERGNCTFKQKAIYAQEAGAIGVVLFDDVAGEAPPALGTDPTLTTVVTIPMLSVSQADGATLEAGITTAPPGGEVVLLSRAAGVDRDGTIDNTLVAHEWGHYLHLRLVTCTSPQCLAESEGWGDFNALMMMVRDGDNLTGTYAIGQYAAAGLPDDPAYYGIRRYPYTTDLGKSPLTFKYITDGVALPTTIPVATSNAGPNASPQAAGEIWASMVFEGYASMLQQAVGSTAFAAARRRMSDYVVAGMMAAPVTPTYTEQRDALLAVAAAADMGNLELLAQGFAKRGAGTCAVSPATASVDFSGVTESFTVSPNLILLGATVDDSVSSCDGIDGYLDAGETGRVTVHVINAGPTTMAGATATVSSTTAGVTFPQGGAVTFGSLGPFAAGTGTAEVALAPSVSGKQTLALAVTLAPSATCTPQTLETASWINVVEEPASSTIDDVEEKSTAWTTSGALADAVWSRLELTPGNHVWAGIDYPATSDTRLVSPPLEVGRTAPFVLTFDHRHAFENSDDENGVLVDWDGGVIEVSTDQGVTWTDISAYGDPGYGGTIGEASGAATNVLQGRSGYVASNASWPATDKVTIDMGQRLAGTTVQIRFRIGTDASTGDVGWQIDNIGLQGITNKPFASLVHDTVSCGDAGAGEGGASGGAGGGPFASGGVGGGVFAPGALQAGGGCAVAPSGGGSGPSGALLLALGALLGVRRRRRCWIRGSAARCEAPRCRPPHTAGWHRSP